MVDAARLREELRRMRALIQEDPAVKAQFDKDGNGVIDGDEWEEVRQLVIQRLEREQEEADERSRLEAEMRDAGEATGLDTPVDLAASGAVAQGIYEEDLRAPQTTGSASSIADLDEVSLQQQGGMGQLLEGAFRREYTILAPDGSTIGSVHQRENELLQDAMNRSLFEVPDLHFDVVDARTGERLVFKRSEGLARQRMGVFDERGMIIATTDWKFHLIWKKYEVCATLRRQQAPGSEPADASFHSRHPGHHGRERRANRPWFLRARGTLDGRQQDAHPGPPRRSEPGFTLGLDCGSAPDGPRARRGQEPG